LLPDGLKAVWMAFEKTPCIFAVAVRLDAWTLGSGRFYLLYYH
jgi:hypothetical protein